MKELYSNGDDCLELARTLSKALKGKIKFYGSCRQEVISGVYYCQNWTEFNDYYEYKKSAVHFWYKFCAGGFLRISVGESVYEKSTGEKLAVLSDFYEVLSREFGNPTLFYTTKDDDEKCLNLEWSFVNKEETIQSFKNGTAFDDAEIDKLIIIGEIKSTVNGFRLNDTSKQIISQSIGLPFELISLVDENIEDYAKCKFGTEITYPEDAKIDGYPITPVRKRKK